MSAVTVHIGALEAYAVCNTCGSLIGIDAVATHAEWHAAMVKR